MPITEDLIIRAAAEGIARREGFYKVGKIPMVSQRTNNPGNLPHRKYLRRVREIAAPQGGNRWDRKAVRCERDAVTRKWWETEWIPYPEQNGFVVFPECREVDCTHDDHPCEIGWSELRAQCRTNIIQRQLTFLEFFQGKRVGKKTIYMGFSPSCNKTDPYEYANDIMSFVARRLGLSPESVTLHTRMLALVDGKREQVDRRAA